MATKTQLKNAQKAARVGGTTLADGHRTAATDAGASRGPWRNEWNDAEAEHHILGPRKADGFSEVIGTAMRRDNARVIAAAPDMLALLKQIRPWFEEWLPDAIGPAENHLLDMVAIVIAQAEGVPNE